MNWKHLFRSIILQRGYDYYLRKKVTNLEYKNGIVSACVEGSDDYYVQIRYDEDKIKYMDCDCPYACDGNNCKHMAAVLYEIEDHPDLFEEPYFETVEETVNRCSEDELREFVLEIVQHNSHLLYDLRRRLPLPDSMPLQDKINYELNEITKNSYSINLLSNKNKYHQLYQFIDEKINDLIETDPAAAFDILNNLFVKIYEISTVSFSEEKNELIKKSFEKILSIYNKKDSILNEYIFNDLFNKMMKKEDSLNKDLLIDFLYSHFDVEEFVYVKIEYAKDEIDKMLKLGDEKGINFWSRKYLKELSKTNIESEALKKECDKYFDDIKVRKIYADYLIDNQFYEDGIEVYEKIMDELLEKASNRSVYQEVSNYIQDISKIKGGMDKAIMLIEKYMMLYPKRVAMKKEFMELKKVLEKECYEIREV